MPAAALPEDEDRRLAALWNLDILDSPPTAALDAIARAASLVCGVPIALISLVDKDRQWFKANIGLEDVKETHRDLAFCAHAILGDGIMAVENALEDARFADNPLVLGDPNIRSYTGAPLMLPDGSKVGTLCVIDRQPRRLDARQLAILEELACAASEALEQWRVAQLQQATAQQLRESEEFLEQTSELAGVGGWTLDFATMALTWTAGTYRLHGVSFDFEPTYENAIAFFPPDVRPVVEAAVKFAIQSGESWNLELPLIRADGQQIWIRLYGAVTRENGKPVRATGAIQDITARVNVRHALQEAQERVNIATNSGQIGIWDINLVTGEKIWSDWMYRLYGMEPEEGSIAHEVWQNFLHPEDKAATERALSEAIAGKHPYDIEYRVVWEDGSVRHLRASGSVTTDNAGRAVRMVGANWDVTDSRRMEAELNKQHELLRVTLESIGDGVITTDAMGRLSWMNPVAERLTGWTAAEAIGLPLPMVFNILNEQTREPSENPVAACLASGDTVGLASHTLLISRTGAEYGVEDSTAPIRNAAGEILGTVLVFHDVTAQRQLSGEMTFRATHDALTGLLSRAEFEGRLRYTLTKAQADRKQSTLLFIDLDQFKLVNDACGHEAGDQLLKAVAKIFDDVIRGSDTLARLGGDEFAILLDRCAVDQAEKVAQKICARMEDYRFVHHGQRFRIGTSIGLVPVDERWPDIMGIMQAADSACYAAKEAGRNRVHLWSDTDKAMNARHGEMRWASRLAQALDEERFVLFAQRIEQLHQATGAAAEGIHAEVLLRLVEHDQALIMPSAFLPAAERFHVISSIDRWVLERAIRWMNEAPSLDMIAMIAVNLSGQSVGDAAFHAWAIERLADAGPRICNRLCLEITETAVVTNLSDAAVFIERVRGVGVRVALDDFGAGASSFGYLKTMPVDFLKIDGQFVTNLLNDPLDEAAVRCFADVAAVAGMKTIAEFVDDPGVLAKLRDMGVDYAQGYLIHKPAPIELLLTRRTAMAVAAAGE